MNIVVLLIVYMGGRFNGGVALYFYTLHAVMLVLLYSRLQHVYVMSRTSRRDVLRFGCPVLLSALSRRY